MKIPQILSRWTLGKGRRRVHMRVTGLRAEIGVDRRTEILAQNARRDDKDNQPLAFELHDWKERARPGWR